MGQFKKSVSDWGIRLSKLAIAALLLQNCSNVHLQKTVEPAQVMQNLGDLKVEPSSFVRYNKVLFVVDKSGSNFANGGPNGGPGNDPQNNKRAGSMEIFLEEKRDDPYYKWGYIVFVDSQAQAWITEPDSQLGRFGTAEDMEAALKKQRSVADNGCTPYMAALNLARSTIERDIEQNPEEDSIYNVFFMSDGFPNDAISGPGCGNQLRAIKDEPNDPYLMAVDSLRKTAPDRIFLSTAYYTEKVNDPDRSAGDGLKYMSERGGGNFVDLQGQGTIKFDEVQIGKKPIPLIIKRMFVVNLNSGFCLDGTVGSDSDSDGICDSDEERFNSDFATKLGTLGKKFDPADRNSIDPSYMDSFSYKQLILPTGQGLKKCNIKDPDQDFDFLNTCEELLMVDKAPNGPTPQWTQAMLKGGTESKNPDSDGDGFLDGLEWLTFSLTSSAVNFQSLYQPFAKDLTGERIIREHRNPVNPEVFGPDQYDGRLVYLSTDKDGLRHYRYDQNQLALYHTLAVPKEKVGGLTYLAHEADENIILVYYIAVPEDDPNGRGFLRYSFQKFKFNDSSTNVGLKFDKFETYLIPKKTTPN